MNWRACNFANTYGWECADSFAEFMGADYDTNGDSQVDSVALQYVQGESEADYVTRITQTLRSTIRDSNDGGRRHIRRNRNGFERSRLPD
jgi:hypothetical protein